MLNKESLPSLLSALGRLQSLDRAQPAKVAKNRGTPGHPQDTSRVELRKPQRAEDVEQPNVWGIFLRQFVASL